MPDIANNITIRRNGISIDGTRIPWAIAAEPITVDLPAPGKGCGIVYLPVLVDDHGAIDINLDTDLDTTDIEKTRAALDELLARLTATADPKDPHR